MKLRLAMVMVGITLCSFLTEVRTVLKNKGLDTLVNVVQAWAKAYCKVDPDIAVAALGGGWRTTRAALINDTANIANARRTMKKKEIALVKSKGLNHVQLIVGYAPLPLTISAATASGQTYRFGHPLFMYTCGEQK